MNTISAGPWALVLELQHSASVPAVGPRTFGCDEALEVLLDGIGQGAPPDARVVRNLCANRAGKDRYRRRLARADVRVPSCQCPVHTIHVKDMIAFVQAAVGDDEFRLLLEVVETSYIDVASSQGVPVGTLKARVSRAKARAREAWAARCGSTFLVEAEAA